MRGLLDVNVLLALLDADHVDHVRAQRFLDDQIAHGWASCPLTQNGFIRIISQPRYPSPVPTVHAIRRLGAAAAHEAHEFWPDDISLLDGSMIASDQLLGARQVTDAYLLALAVAHGGRLVTFDHAVPVDAVPGADASHLLVL